MAQLGPEAKAMVPQGNIFKKSQTQKKKKGQAEEERRKT